MNYLFDNLITIQLTLLAINTATIGVVVSKLQDVKIRYKELDVKPIMESLLGSLKEQVFLIAVAIGIIILIDSDITSKFKYTSSSDFVLETIMITIFVNSVQVLWDTGKSIFVLINILEEVNKNND